MLMSAIDCQPSGGKLARIPSPRAEGNICRGTVYHNIVKSVLDAAGRMKVSQAANSPRRPLT